MNGPKVAWLVASPLLLACPAFTAGVAQTIADSWRSPISIPGGIADPDQRIGYVAGAEGTVDAIDLASGRLVWSRPDLSWPLAVADHRLAALMRPEPGSRAIRVGFIPLAAPNQGEFLRSDPLPLPEGLRPGTATFPFTALQVRISDKRLFIGWRLPAPAPSGVPQRRAFRPAGQRDGGIVVDLANGRATPQSPEAARAIMSPKAPPQSSRVHRSRVYSDGYTNDSRPLTAGGDKLAILALSPSTGEQTLGMEVWDPAKDDEPVMRIPLLKGEALAAFVSPDHRHIFAHEQVSDQSPDPGRELTWVGYSLDTLEQATATVPLEAKTDAAAVVGPFLLTSVEAAERRPAEDSYLVGRMLIARDSRTGQRLWSRPILGKPVGVPRPDRS